MTDCPVPQVLSTMRLVAVSLAAITGKASAPSAAIRRSLITPVVVDSQPPLTPVSRAGRPRVQRVDQVAAVVDDQVRACGLVQGPLDVPVVAAPVHPGPGEDRDPVPVRQRRRDVVLGGQRVGGGQRDGRAARLQQPHQHRGLGRDVQAGRDAPAPSKGRCAGEAAA